MYIQAEKLSQITLSQPQKIAGILMSKGTKLETDVDLKRTQPENVNLERKMLPASPKNLPYKQDTEPLVYLNYCVLEDGQTVSLSTFRSQVNFQLGASRISRKSDTFRNVAI